MSTPPTFIPTSPSYNHTNVSLYWRANGTNWYGIHTIDNSIVVPDETVWALAESVNRGETIAGLADTKALPELSFNAYDYAPDGANAPRLIDAVNGEAGFTSVTTATKPVDSKIILVDMLIVFDARTLGGSRTERTAYAVALTPAAPAMANTGTTRAWTGKVFGPLETVVV